MVDLFPPADLLAAFVAASLVLAVTPGPGVLFIVARSAAHGRRAGLASVAGVALGNLGGAAGAALGLAALFAVSSHAFVLVKYAGAAYLVYLGIRTLRDAGRASGMSKTADLPSLHSHSRMFRDGLVVALLNPKTTIFFAAFLPQFMAHGADPVAQGLALGTLFVLIAAVTDALYAVAAGSLGALLRGRKRVERCGRWFSGGTFVGLGLFAALGDTRRPA